MAKASKRTRKFNATGGIKGRLEKGTIKSNGKLRKRKKPTSDRDTAQGPTVKKDMVEERRDQDNDFMSEKNLGDLDMDAFFENINKSIEGELANQNKELSDSEGSSGSEEDDGDNLVDHEEHREKDEEDVTSSSEIDSDSDDENIEKAEARMKAEMAKMKNHDPDFHKFLKENEGSLLHFGGEDDEESHDQVGKVDDVEDHDDEENEDRDSKNEVIELTPELLEALERGTFKSHGLKALKKLIGAYRSACHLADSISDQEKARPGESGSSYSIQSSKVYDKLMLMCLNRCHEEFKYHFFQTQDDIDDGTETESDNKPINAKKFENSEKWPDLRPILLSFFRSTLHIMSEAKEPELLALILKALSKYLPMMTPFPRIADATLKSLVNLWSAPLDSSEDYQVVRLHAFVRIRQLALTQPFPFIEDCLKKTYLAYAKRAKFGTGSSVATSLPTLTFMGNCLVELYSLDYHSSYQHAFVYIRQLALILRSAIQKKTAESFQQLFCWQYIHCAKLWVAVLSSAASKPDGSLLRSLIYPLTEVILGMCRLSPSPVRHLPLRFHCIRLLQKLAASSEQFIPTTSILLDVLDFKEWSMAPKKTKTGNARGIQMQFLLKLPKDDALRTYEQLEAGMSEFILLVEREIELYRYSAGFPEFSVRIVQVLRQFAKQTRNARWRTYCRGCIDTCDKYSKFAVTERSKLHEAPKNIARLECLLPPSTPNMLERHEASIQKEMKDIEASRLVESSKEQSSGSSTDASKRKMTPEKKATTKRAKTKTPNKEEMDLDDDILEQEDRVQEGVQWSDEE